MSGNVESHIRDPKRNPNIKNKVVDRILRALFENEDCLAASLSWEEFRDRELEIASEIQLQLLPRKFPQIQVVSEIYLIDKETYILP